MKAVKNVIVLTVITVLAGLLLGYVYDITKGPIADANEKAKQEAYKSVYPTADSFEVISNFSSDEASNYVASKGFTGVTLDEALYAKDSSGNNIGYVLTATSPNGYGGDVQISVGLSNDCTINGIAFLTLNETAGLGMKANTDEFKSQFEGMNVSKISYTKTGKQADYEIDAISGATITTSAVTEDVNAVLEYFNVLNGGVGE